MFFLRIIFVILFVLFFADTLIGADTLDIVGIMIEFEEDDIGDNTTGTGRFNTDPDRDETYLDGVSHDKDYFEKHLEFAQNYFSRISNDNLYIKYAVYRDKQPDIANKLILNYKMKHYRPSSKEDKESNDEFYMRLNQGIMKLTHDALRASADAGLLDEGTKIVCPDGNDSVTVKKDKTIFLVFHAGASGLTDGGLMGELFADTPSDLIDSYIDPVDFNEYHGEEYYDNDTTIKIEFDKKNNKYGIYSRDSSNFVNKLLICSETASQDDIAFGINGIIVNQIARAIGLPDLWDTKEGINAIGSFCLMDFLGYSSYNGFLPVMPSAWCRIKMGWQKPITANPDNNFQFTKTIYSKDTSGLPTIIKVPLSSSEYYLIEARGVTDTLSITTDMNTYEYDMYDSINPPLVRMISDSLCSDYDNDKDSCLSYSFNNKRPKGVLLSSNNYDVGIPGFGVLIWHIDETVINEKIDENGINNNIDRRGVDLEEADGIEDIGLKFSDFLGQTSQYSGGPEDFFPHYDYHNNTVINEITPFNFKRKNSNTDRYFSTHTNTGAYTGISITIDTFETAERHKYLNVQHYGLTGNKRYVALYEDDSFKVTIDWVLKQGDWPKLSFDEKSMQHVVSIDSTIYTLSKDGNIIGFTYFGDTSLIDSVSQISLSSPSVYDSCLVFSGFTDTSQSIILYDTYNKTSNSILSLKDDTVSTLIAVSRQKILFGTRNGYLYDSDINGNFDSLKLDASKINCLSVDSQFIRAVSDSKIFLVSRNNFEIENDKELDDLKMSSGVKIAAADISLAFEGAEICLNDNSGNVCLVSNMFEVLPGWPVKIDSKNAVSPSLGDIDNDNLTDIIIPGNSAVYAFNYTGTNITGWPFKLNKNDGHGQFISSASLVNIDNDSDMEIFVPSNNGNIIILDGDASYYEFVAGSSILARTLSFGGEPGPSCVVKNIDKDSAVGVSEHMEIFTRNKNGYISCFNIENGGQSPYSWETEGGSFARTYFYEKKSDTSGINNNELKIDTLFTYPNPVKTNRVTVKYKLTKSAEKVELKLFNSVGDIIIKKKGLNSDALWNHYKLDISDIAPGLYILKIEAHEKNKNKFKFTKVGILR